ncbi:hypothetical protein BT96DRAFT_971222 [Gymnopus androsaceus JB14]|uniref:Uncharacterized protein n=1 Tax=Gymnopus androsaceus JB14 TaxID=1447944 RepID=A0A6A4IFT5_9AGAR|nr:hypothetical protein BT96DRAFT_971222 [Gymnopus androsaceus JB14]
MSTITETSTIPFPLMMMQSSLEFDSTSTLKHSLPVEITQLIIHHTWALPLSTFERAHLMKSSLLVSLCWMTLFVRETLTDVHLISGDYALKYDGFIHGRRRSDSEESVYTTIARVDSDAARWLCRSITVHCIDLQSVPQPPEAKYLGPMHPMGGSAHVVANLLQFQQSAYSCNCNATGKALPNFTGRVSVQFDCKVPIDILDVLNMHLPEGLEGVRRRALAFRDKGFWTIELIGVGVKAIQTRKGTPSLYGVRRIEPSAAMALYSLLIILWRWLWSSH